MSLKSNVSLYKSLLYDTGCFILNIHLNLALICSDVPNGVSQYNVPAVSLTQAPVVAPATPLSHCEPILLIL